jgi:flagellar protein FliS
MNTYTQAMNQYKTIDLQDKFENASPHELILLLLQGAKTHISQAKGFILQKQVAAKGEHISKAISIFEGLRQFLDHEKAPTLSNNLDRLYEYNKQILLKANLDNDPQLLDKALDILEPIYDAWTNIGKSHQ